MTSPAALDVESFACADSTLRLDVTDFSYEEHAARTANPAGSCKFAQMVLRGGGSTYEDIVAECPEIMHDLHAKGAPSEIKCAIQLMYFCRANPVAGE